MRSAFFYLLGNAYKSILKIEGGNTFRYIVFLHDRVRIRYSYEDVLFFRGFPESGKTVVKIFQGLEKRCTLVGESNKESNNPCGAGTKR